jgi:hypothetical protein
MSMGVDIVKLNDICLLSTSTMSLCLSSCAMTTGIPWRSILTYSSYDFYGVACVRFVCSFAEIVVIKNPLGCIVGYGYFAFGRGLRRLPKYCGVTARIAASELSDAFLAVSSGFYILNLNSIFNIHCFCGWFGHTIIIKSVGMWRHIGRLNCGGC